MSLFELVSEKEAFSNVTMFTMIGFAIKKLKASQEDEWLKIPRELLPAKTYSAVIHRQAFRNNIKVLVRLGGAYVWVGKLPMTLEQRRRLMARRLKESDRLKKPAARLGGGEQVGR